MDKNDTLRKSKKHECGWHPPIATQLTKYVFDQNYRIIDMSQPLHLPLEIGGKNEQIDEDIYPLV